MLDSNTILGTRGYLDCDEYEHGLLSQNNDVWPCGTPIVYPANALKKDLRLQPSMNVYTLAPPNQVSHGIEVISVRVEAINPVGLKPLWNSHKVLTVSRFDIDKFSRLLEFVRDVGAISLVIEYEGGRKEAAESIRKLGGFFKYSSIFFYNSFSNKVLWGKDDSFVCVLTFLDIPYCVPLFNTQKVDGIGLSFSGATVKASKQLGYLNRTFRTDFIYTNYEENVFFMDGIAVNEMRSPDSRIFDELTARAGEHPPIGKPEVAKGGQLGYPSDSKVKISGGTSSWKKQYMNGLVQAEDTVGPPIEHTVDPSSEEVASPLYNDPLASHGTLYATNEISQNQNLTWSFDTEAVPSVEETEPDDTEPTETEPEEGGN
jgi:hypothetical protein